MRGGLWITRAAVRGTMCKGCNGYICKLWSICSAMMRRMGWCMHRMMTAAGIGWLKGGKRQRACVHAYSRI